jgi:hypothetical protein
VVEDDDEGEGTLSLEDLRAQAEVARRAGMREAEDESYEFGAVCDCCCLCFFIFGRVLPAHVGCSLSLSLSCHVLFPPPPSLRSSLPLTRLSVSPSRFPLNNSHRC